jgi:putative phosphoribosyl transferase
MPVIFEDRAEAGAFLATKLMHYTHRPDVLVLGLPRGGIPVAYPIAQALGAPLDVFVVRKLGVPGQEELAMGAIAMGEVIMLNNDLIVQMGVSPAVVESVIKHQTVELSRRESLYRGNRPALSVQGRTIILVDDGLATGATMLAAVVALQRMQPTKIVIAVPVATKQICEAFQEKVDEIVCAITPSPFIAVGAWYKNFSQTTDDEVRALLDHAAHPVSTH